VAIQPWQDDWMMVGLRVTRLAKGGTEFDIVWRSRGQVQYVQPVASLMHEWSELTDVKTEYLHDCLLEAVRTMISAMVENGGFRG
jgi:hypothetical protein